MTEEEAGAGRTARLMELLRRWDAQPRIVRGAKAVRNMLPGDSDYGDPLSVAGSEPPHILGQRLSAVTAQRPSAMREVGLSALQVWQSLSEAQGRGRGDEEMTILFTDLVEFSSWALEAGDTMAVDLLRQVGKTIEPIMERHGGRVVKRIGDGLMAVFEEPQAALAAACEATSALGEIEVGGHRPQLRAGLHVGRPRSIGGDLLGVDVNIAARVAEAAGAGEVLVSEAACRDLDEQQVSLKRKRRFKAKGAPKDLEVYSAQLA